MFKKMHLNRFVFITTMLAITGWMLVAAPATAGEQTRYPDIPRIDVHTHITSNTQGIANHLGMRELLKQKHGDELALWINLGSRTDNHPDPVQVARDSKDRMLCCIADFDPHRGLDYPPQDLAGWMKKGYIGYKIWAGPPARVLKPGEQGFPYIDDPAHEASFAEIERLGILVASIHIADPNGPWGNRTKWLADPVDYWRQQTAFRHVLERHPKMHVVAAHAVWLICQDAQIDCLRNLLATYPNLNIDLSATFQYYNLVQRDNLRSFMIEYADRILFGTDVGFWQNPRENAGKADWYHTWFQILETAEDVPGKFYATDKIKGLDLPREVLEKIYYRNAMRIYPGVREAMLKLGYAVE